MYKQADTCPVCGEGKLVGKVVVENFSYKGHALNVPDYHILECPTCGEAMVEKESARNAEKMLRDFGRELDGLLTAADIKRIRLKLHLTQEQMSKVLGGGLKSFARYENGQVMQSRAMDNLMRILDRFPESIDALPSVSGRKPHSGRTVAPRKRAGGAVDMVHEDGEEYKGKR